MLKVTHWCADTAVAPIDTKDVESWLVEVVFGVVGLVAWDPLFWRRVCGR